MCRYSCDPVSFTEHAAEAFGFSDQDEFASMPWQHIDYPFPDIEIAVALPCPIQDIDDRHIEGMTFDDTGDLQR